jgi:glycosyltransferase involved in cell wall biosynthesis
MKVSVVVTCCNGARFLGEQLSSVASQTRLPDEVVVGDDASTDCSARLAREALGLFPGEAKVLEAPSRLGLAANLARCLQVATGDVVFLADHDDVWHPGKVERMLAALGAAPGAEVAFSDGRVVDQAGRPVGRSLWEAFGFGPSERRLWEEAPVKVLARQTVVTGATMALRRELIEAALPVPPACWHDEWFALASVLRGHTPVATPEQLIDYRAHGANLAGLPRRGLRERLAREGWPGEAKVAAWAEACERFGPNEATSYLQGAVELALRRPRNATAPAERLQRVAGLARSRSYSRYGRGWPMALHDLLAPAIYGRPPRR